MATPLLLTNQFTNALSVTIVKPKENPIPTTPHTTRKLQRELMKFIVIKPRARQAIPKSITSRGLYLSLAHPPVGAPIPCTRPKILAAKDVTARPRPNSEAIGLNRTENPRATNPCPKAPVIAQAKTVHQPKYIFCNLGIFTKVLSSKTLTFALPL